MTRERKMNVQLATAVMLAFAGIILIMMGFWVAPAGEIHNSVLVAFGEISTFSGCLFGVDYNYKFKIYGKSDKSADPTDNATR